LVRPAEFAVRLMEAVTRLLTELPAGSVGVSQEAEDPPIEREIGLALLVWTVTGVVAIPPCAADRLTGLGVTVIELVPPPPPPVPSVTLIDTASPVSGVNVTVPVQEFKDVQLVFAI
jgi:hypothetical protein